MSEIERGASKSVRGLGRGLLILYKTIGRLAIASLLIFTIGVAATSGSLLIAVLMFLAYLPMVLMLLWLQDEGDAIWNFYGRYLLVLAKSVRWVMLMFVSPVAWLIGRVPLRIRNSLASDTERTMEAVDRGFDSLFRFLETLLVWVSVVVVLLVILGVSVFGASMLPHVVIHPSVAIIIGALIIAAAISSLRT